MKTIGITRKIDNLGRIVIPKELRKRMNIKKGDSLEIYVEGEKIIFKKYQAGCIFCDKADSTQQYKEKIICNKCINKIKEF